MTQSKPKKLNLIMLITLVCGNMIGSGVFLLPSDLAQFGTISLLSWFFTAAGAILLALVFADLSRKFPKTGGPYAYSRLGLGEFIGFQTAYQYWIALWVGNGAIAIAFVGYLRVFIPQLNNSVATCFTAIGLIWLLTAINITGVRKAGVMQIITTFLKLIPLIIIILFGWEYISFHNYFTNLNISSPHVSNFSAISTSATLTLWAFIGLESATVPADSVENPRRNIPLATIIGTLLAAAVYILSSTIIMGMIPAPILKLSTSPYADGAALIFGHWGRDLIALGAIISCFGTLNGWVLVQGQVAMAAAENKLFPNIFAKRNKANVPQPALLISAGLISLLLLLTISNNLVHQFQTIILIATLATLIPYLYTNISSIILDLKEKDKSGIAWKPIIISFFAALFSCWAILSSGTDTMKYGAIVLISTVPIYAWLRHRNSKSKSSEIAEIAESMMVND